VVWDKCALGLLLDSVRFWTSFKFEDILCHSIGFLPSLTCTGVSFHQGEFSIKSSQVVAWGNVALGKFVFK